MWWDRQRPWTVLVAPVTAGGFMLLYFFLFDRWDKLENPVASQLAIVAAIIGFVTGLAAQRIRRWELVAIPGGLTVAAGLWAYFAPHDTPEDKDFQQILWLLTALLAAGTAVLNLPQITRGRYYTPPAPPEE